MKHAQKMDKESLALNESFRSVIQSDPLFLDLASEKPNELNLMANDSTGGSRSKRTKRVRFLVDDKESIQVQVIPTSKSDPYEDGCGQSSWYDGQEMYAMQRTASKVAEFCLDFRPEYSEIAMEFLTKCPTGGFSFEQDREKLALLASGSGRGLEQLIIPSLQRRRTQTVKAILQAQKRLNGLSADQKWHLIAQQYKRNSLYADRWSHVLAASDASLVC